MIEREGVGERETGPGFPFRRPSLLPLLFLLLLSPALAQSVPAGWPDPFGMKFERQAFTPLKPRAAVLPNGLVVYLIEDRSLPLVSGRMYVRAGNYYDPQEKIGLAALHAQVMRNGGAAGKDPDAVDLTLEGLASSVEVASNTFFTEVSFSSLTDNLDQTLQLWSEIMLRPDYNPQRLELYRGRTLEGIRRRNDQPVGVAQREFIARINANHPSGFISSTQSVQSITRDDLAAFQARYFRPRNAVLALSGDFNSGEMLAKLTRLLSSWNTGAAELPRLPTYNPAPRPTIYFIQRPVTQSVVYMGLPTVQAYRAGYAELDLLSNVFGGGFGSRLFDEIRSRRGLAYQVGSAQQQGFGFPQPFLAVSISRVEKTVEVVQAMLDEARKISAEPVSADELELFRENILNGAPFRFASRQAVVERQARVHLLGLRPGYYEDYLEQLTKITPESMLAAAKRYVRPENFVIVVLGDESKFEAPLSRLGNVVKVEVR
ncbi:MAG: pitrilysin family protein [Meiothermus sp.]|nr:pitrilysin family protein [Meiothermus sp.]